MRSHSKRVRVGSWGSLGFFPLAARTAPCREHRVALRVGSDPDSDPGFRGRAGRPRFSAVRGRTVRNSYPELLRAAPCLRVQGPPDSSRENQWKEMLVLSPPWPRPTLGVRAPLFAGTPVPWWLTLELPTVKERTGKGSIVRVGARPIAVFEAV